MNKVVYTVHIMNNNQKEDATTLGILNAIDDKNDITQRHLAARLNVALGLTNSYLKRCVHKGLVKVHQAPANRYLYYLTPKGFTEKSRLTSAYLSSSFNFYRGASTSINQIYQKCEENNLNNLLLCGISEIAEIALIRSHDHNLKITGVFDPESKKESFLGLPVIKNIEKISSYDAYIITALEDAQNLYSLIVDKIDSNLVFTPSILGINSK